MITHRYNTKSKFLLAVATHRDDMQWTHYFWTAPYLISAPGLKSSSSYDIYELWYVYKWYISGLNSFSSYDIHICICNKDLDR